jgi:hypothetical protein
MYSDGFSLMSTETLEDDSTSAMTIGASLVRPLRSGLSGSTSTSGYRRDPLVFTPNSDETTSKRSGSSSDERMMISFVTIRA